MVLSSLATYSAEAAGIPRKAISTFDKWATSDIPDLSSSYQAVGGKNVANGYAGLNGSTKISETQIPDLSPTYQKVTGKNVANGYAGLNGSTKISETQIPDLSPTYQKVTGKNAANGYAGLDSGTKVPTSLLPAVVVRTDQTNTFGAFDQLLMALHLKIVDDTDASKVLTFDNSGMSGSTTLTIKPLSTTTQTLQIPNITTPDTLDVLGLAQAITGQKTFTNPLILGGGAIKSSSSTPVGFEVGNTALTVGSLGTIVTPSQTTNSLYPTDAQGGNVEGSIVYNRAASELHCRTQNIWIDCNGLDRAVGYIAGGSTAATTISSSGLLTGTATGTVTDSNDNDGRAKNIASAATTGSAAKISTTLFMTSESQYNPVLTVRMKNVEYANSERIWVGFTGAAFPSNTAFTTAHVAIRAVQGTDTTYKLDTADGATQSQTDTGVAVTTNVAHTFRIRIDNVTPQVCVSIDGAAEICKTSNLPAATTNMGVESSVIAGSNAAKNQHFYWMTLEQDG